MSVTAVLKGELLREVLRRHLLLAMLVAFYSAVVWSIPARQMEEATSTALLAAVRNISKFIPQVICIVLIWRVFHATYVVRPANRLTWMKDDILAFLRDRERLVSGVVATVLVSIGLATSGRAKSLIPLLNEFSWDEAFMEIDKALHLGFHPFELVFSVGPGSDFVGFIAYNYSFWFTLIFFVLYTTCFVRPDSPVRMQFLVAFILVWAIGGNLVATIFSSAGPVYYERLGLGPTFAPLEQLLQERSGRAIRGVFVLQDQLWSMYRTSDGLSIISAFPSMHVATSTLMAIVAFHFRRWAGILMSIFAALIMLGSVLLAWHYAVDGYAGALIAVFCWKLSGWLIRSPIGPFAVQRADGRTVNS